MMRVASTDDTLLITVFIVVSTSFHLPAMGKKRSAKQHILFCKVHHDRHNKTSIRFGFEIVRLP